MKDYTLMFIIIVLGYILGRIKIKGLSLGTSGILLVSLVFGHLGYTLPSLVRNIGLVLFVTSIGFIAGPGFVKNTKNKAFVYLFLGFLLTTLGTITCVVLMKIFDLPKSLAVGVFMGAATSTPGLAVALEVSKDELASIGYGIAYPFGVVGTVLIIQILAKTLKQNENVKVNKSADDTTDNSKGIMIDKTGLFSLALAAIIGVLIGKINVPLPFGGKFSLGTTGGPLLMGIIISSAGKIGNFNLSISKNNLKVFQELGLVLFLMGAGVEAGSGFVEVVKQYGVTIFFVGVLITLIPLLIGIYVAIKAFKLDTITALASICGARTSTPSLGALAGVSNREDIASYYAASYPAALIFIVIYSQLIIELC